MSDDAVLYEVRDHIGLITLNRPENRNSMTEDVFAGLVSAIGRAREDAMLRCVIITGNGTSFCAGADFKSQLQRDTAQLPNERSFAMYAPFLSILDIEVPVVGALNGHAIGGGLGLALVCDIRIANADAKYGASFVKLGLHPGMATTYLLPRLVGVPRAAELLFAGRVIKGSEAERFGLVNYAVPADQVMPRSWELASEIAAAAPIAVRMTKQSLYENVSWDPVPAARIEAHKQSRTVETDDADEGIKALLEKRKPKFQAR